MVQYRATLEYSAFKRYDHCRFAEEAEGQDLGQLASFLQLYGRLAYTPGIPALYAAARVLEATPASSTDSSVRHLLLMEDSLDGICGAFTCEARNIWVSPP